jgi:hypothetical protein
MLKIQAILPAADGELGLDRRKRRPDDGDIQGAHQHPHKKQQQDLVALFRVDVHQARGL